MRFLTRLGVGFLKGLVIGAIVAGLFQIGLGWTHAPGLLGYLLAMGIAATAGVLGGTPPWRAEAWLEAVLKGVFGVGVGALLYGLGSGFARFEVPFALAGSEEGAAWTAIPLLFGPAIAAIYGAIVELDNTSDDARVEPK